MKLIFLAAGKGKRIYKKIKKNKCLIEINGKTLIENLVNEVKKTKILRENDTSEMSNVFSKNGLTLKPIKQGKTDARIFVDAIFHLPIFLYTTFRICQILILIMIKFYNY